MRSLKALFFVFVFVFVCNHAFAQDFSADIISSANGQVFYGKIFTSGGKVRMEAQGAINIVRPDKKLVWVIMPEQRMYMEMPLDVKNMLVGSTKVANEQTRELVAKDNIDGKEVSKYKVVYDSGNKKETLYMWVLEESDIPIKTLSEDGSWSIEYKNVKIGNVSADLFSMPSGYEKLSMGSPDMSRLGKMLDK
jgi:hypothetical protein